MSKAPSLDDLYEMVHALGQRAPLTSAERTRARIVKAATLLFQQHGYRRTSVDEVARAAHVAKGSVYVHFENKAQLLAAAIAEEKAAFAHHLAPLLKQKLPPKERLRRYLQKSFEIVPSIPLVSKLISGDEELYVFLEDLGPELREQISELQVGGLLALMKGVGRFDRLPRAEQRDRALALLAMLNGLVNSMLKVQGHPGLLGLAPARYAELLATVLVEGVAG